MPEPITIALYSDVHCPYAYVTAFRLRELRAAFRGRVTIAYKCLSLEYVNKKPTPKHILDNESPLLMLEEPEIPYEPWHAPMSAWPSTMWPAFEAIKCAERQSPDLAAELDWAIRKAFFAESRCIALRHVLFELAEGAGLDMARFAEDWDGGVAKRLVLEESREGWERLKVEGSPTFVLPSGEQRPYLGLPKVKLDLEHSARVLSVTPAPCEGQGCREALRAMMEEAVGGG